MQGETLIDARLAELHHRARTDTDFQTQLQKDPHAVLEEYFGPIDRNIEIRVVQDTDRVKHLHVKAPPPQNEISDQDLLQAQGGTSPVCIVGGIITALSAVSVSVQTIAQASYID
ncbi:hypothetical protein [Ruegeria jejuensis]|uniref:hypothetical protein n=1 Tax=Ruegeria jejuensis TaxID=3233338 RepID=UPI00355B126C